MKTNSFITLGLLTMLVMGLTACSDDKEIDPYYEDIEDERVIAELEDVPAYVCDSYKGYVFICYSKYADVYYDICHERSEDCDECPTEILDDLADHKIGVKLSDFNRYGIELKRKVYVSAYVTNNQRAKIIQDGSVDPGWGTLAEGKKSYLKNLKPRN